MGVGADGAELRSEDASRRAEGAQDGRKHGALERRSGSVFLKERARRSDKAGTWSQGVTPTKETFGLASSQKTYREPLKAGTSAVRIRNIRREPGREQGLCFPHRAGGRWGRDGCKLSQASALSWTWRDRETETDRDRQRTRGTEADHFLLEKPWGLIHIYICHFTESLPLPPTPNELAIIPFHKYPNLSGLTKVVQLATIDLGTQNWVWIWYRSSLALKDTGSSDFGAYHWWENKTSNFSSVVGDGSSEIIKRYSTMICAACRYKQTYHTIA